MLGVRCQEYYAPRVTALKTTPSGYVSTAGTVVLLAEVEPETAYDASLQELSC